MGGLIRQKDPKDIRRIAKRIRAINVDVLVVQEVEHIGILRSFNQCHLGDLYPHMALIEGNDNRFIDVGLLSKLPIGPITSHQTATHPDDPATRVFGRDLVQVEIRDLKGSKLFNLYNTHLKSHFVPHNQDPCRGADLANLRRKRQAESIKSILCRTERRGAKFVLLGDMNDPPESEFLAPMLDIDGDVLSNALSHAKQSRPAKKESPCEEPKVTNWTHRFKEARQPPRHEQFDQIWLSPRLSQALISAHIDRRKRHGGDGSDHDPAWIVLDPRGARNTR